MDGRRIYRNRNNGSAAALRGQPGPSAQLSQTPLFCTFPPCRKQFLDSYLQDISRVSGCDLLSALELESGLGEPGDGGFRTSLVGVGGSPNPGFCSHHQDQP